MNGKTAVIRIQRDTKERLDAIRGNGQTRSGVIDDLLALYEVLFRKPRQEEDESNEL